MSEVVYQIPSFDFYLSMCLVRGDVGWICHANNSIPCVSRCEMTKREMARTSWLWRTDVTARSPIDCERDGPRRFSPLRTALFPFQLRLVCVYQPKVLSVTVTTNFRMNRMARRLKGIWGSITAKGYVEVDPWEPIAWSQHSQSGYCPSLCAMEKSWDKCLLKWRR